jgi:hypothetical protein
MVQVAKRGASVLKRRKSRNRMDAPARAAAAAAAAAATAAAPTAASAGSTNGAPIAAAASSNGDAPTTPAPDAQITKSESDADVVFYTEEPRSGEYCAFVNLGDELKISIKTFKRSKDLYQTLAANKMGKLQKTKKNRE